MYIAILRTTVILVSDDRVAQRVQIVNTYISRRSRWHQPGALPSDRHHAHYLSYIIRHSVYWTLMMGVVGVPQPRVQI